MEAIESMVPLSGTGTVAMEEIVVMKVVGKEAGIEGLIAVVEIGMTQAVEVVEEVITEITTVAQTTPTPCSPHLPILKIHRKPRTTKARQKRTQRINPTPERIYVRRILGLLQGANLDQKTMFRWLSKFLQP
jgi:hypothetical protein